jgi:hypothetical protein
MMPVARWSSLFFILTRMVVVALAVAPKLPAPVGLLVEGLEVEVAVISEARPRFSFLHGASISSLLPRGSVQASYRLTVTPVGGEEEGKKAVWDSGAVLSRNSTQIVYAGSALQAFTRYSWTAQWTASGGASSASATSTFETGPMAVADWHNASWLQGSQNRLVVELPTGKAVVWARAYIAAVGCHSLEINGQIPAPDLRGICPWPVNSANIRYQTHDISALMTPGNNGVGLLSGQVMTSSPRVMALFMAYMSDGSKVVAKTGETGWMERPSYVIRGEAWQTDINWTQQEAGWSLPSFKPGSEWKPASVTATPVNPAIALAMPLSIVLNEVKPISVSTTTDGGFLYQFPKNFVGTIRVQPLPAATAGSELELLLGEWLGAEPPPPKPPTPAPPPAPTTVVKCGTAPENSVLTLGGCKAGSSIDKLVFASFGTPTGDCTHGFKVSKCNSANSTQLVEKLCLGKTSCKVSATVGFFGGDPCVNVLKYLSAAVHCSGDPPPPPPTPSPPPPPLPPPAPPPAPGGLTWPKISGGQQQYENHILRAGNPTPLETLFCWHGFIYVRVTPKGNTGFKGTIDSIVGLEIHTNMTQAGHLKFGGGGDAKATAAAAVLDGINQMTLQSQRTNVAAYMPTDCPTREKHGCAHVTAFSFSPVASWYNLRAVGG